MDKQGLFRIGDVARLFNLSVGTLRHYEKSGLLQPETIDPATGYRYYSVRQFEALNTIRYLRVLGTPLPQIADFLKSRNVGRMQELLLRQKQEAARRQRELESIQRKIDNRLRQLDDALSSTLDEIRMVDSPPRRIVRLSRSLSIESCLDLEMPLRQLEGRQKDALVFLGKIGVGIAREHLLAQQYAPYDVVFLLLDPEDVYEGDVETLPGGACASVRFRGSHGEAPAQYARLMAFIGERGLQAAGFSREITMIDYGLTSDTEQFVTEIQIPVCR